MAFLQDSNNSFKKRSSSTNSYIFFNAGEGKTYHQNFTQRQQIKSLYNRWHYLNSIPKALKSTVDFVFANQQDKLKLHANQMVNHSKNKTQQQIKTYQKIALILQNTPTIKPQTTKPTPKPPTKTKPGPCPIPLQTNHHQTQKTHLSKNKGIPNPLYHLLKPMLIFLTLFLLTTGAFASANYKKLIPIPDQNKLETTIITLNYPIRPDEVLYNNYETYFYLVAYDKNGNELEWKHIDNDVWTEKELKIKELFPDYYQDIGAVEVYFANGSFVSVLNSTPDKSKNAASNFNDLSVYKNLPINDSIIIPHVAKGFWKTYTAIYGKEDGDLKIRIFPDNIEDNLNEKNLQEGRYSFIDLGELCNQLSTANDYAVAVRGEKEQTNPLVNPEPFKPLVWSSFFNDKSGATTTNVLPSNYYFVPHAVINQYWWSGTAIFNPNNYHVDVKFLYKNNKGELVSESDWIKIGPYEKLTDVFNNLGAPENFEGSVEIISAPNDEEPLVKELSDMEINNVGNYTQEYDEAVDKLIKEKSGLIYSVSLFGFKNQESIAGVANFPGIRGAHFYTFEQRVNPNEIILPFVKSDENNWYGIALINNYDLLQRVELYGINKNGGDVEDIKLIELKPGEKFVILTKDLFTNHKDINYIMIKNNDDTVYGNGLKYNGPITAFYIRGTTDHKSSWGAQGINASWDRSTLLSLINLTRGFHKSLESLVKNKELKIEDNDQFSTIIKGQIDNTWNTDNLEYPVSIGQLGLVLLDPETLNKEDYWGYKLYDEYKVPNKVVGAYGGSIGMGFTDIYGVHQLGIGVQYGDLGNDKEILVRLPIKVSFEPEKDYYVNEIYANGGGDPAYQNTENPSRAITKDKIEELAKILSTEGVLYLGGRQMSYDEAYDMLSRYLDNDESNGEINNVIIYDLDAVNGVNYGYNQINFVMTRGPPDDPWVIPKSAYGEFLMEKLKKIYGVNDR